MNATARLGLGTVQFGFDYGVTNRRGRVGDDEARRVLRMAAAAGVSVIHTSSTYGDSEVLLGGEAETIAPMRIVSKLPPIRAAALGSAEIAALSETLARSRSRLGRKRLDSVLFHAACELHVPGARHVLDMLREAKARGQIGRIGVTAYDPQDLWSILDIFQPELVQIPLNLLDQRFCASGLLTTLKKGGAEIHARSLFLQGTLLVEPDGLPGMLREAGPAFAAVADFIALHRLDRLQACLAYGLSVREVDNLVLGVTGADELAGILRAVRGLPAALPDFATLAIDDERIVNPTHWH
jgi:aryl-alcohol dehydrogenase-like predicted oxidoreductase